MTFCPGPEPLRRHAPARRVLAQARDVVRALEHALALHAQDVDDVGRLHVGDVVGDLAAHRLDPARDQRRRSDERDAGAHEDERLDVRARDPRVEHVAHDRHVEPLDPAELLVERVQVEQCLRRVLVLPVPGVDDVRGCVPRGQVRGADVRVADHDDVGVVGADRQQRVLEGLALLDRRAGGLDGHDVRGQALGGELEARRRPRRGLEEEVHDRASAQRRQLLDVALQRPREGAGEREQALDVLPLQVGDRDHVPPGRRLGWQELRAEQGSDVGHRLPHFPGAGTSRTRSTSSTSTSCTCTRSSWDVGRFLPT